MIAVFFSIALTLQADEARVDQLLKDLSDKSQRKRDAASAELTKNAVSWWKIFEAKAPEVKDEKQKKLLADLIDGAKKRDPDLMKTAAEELLQSDVLGQQLRFAGVFEDRLRGHLKEQKFEPDDAALFALLLHLAPKLTSADLKASVAHSLGRLGSSASAPALETLTGWLKDESSVVRAASIDSLADLRAKDTADRVLAMANDPVPLVRFRAVRAMAALGSKNHVAKLESLLSEADARLRETALETIFALDPDGAVRKARSLLSDMDPLVRHRCLKMLMSKREREAHADIAKLFKDKEPTIRADAIRFMTRMRVTDHMDAACELKDDPDETVRIRLVQAIRLLDQRDRLQTLDAMIRNGTSEVKFEIAKAIGALGTKEFVKQLKDLARDRAARYAVLQAYARLSATEQIPEIIRLAKNQDQEEAYRGIDVLAEMRAAEGIPVMVENLKPDRGRACVSSIVGLGLLGDKGSMDKILSMQGNRAEMQIAIPLYLMAVGAKEKADVVEKYAKDRNDQITRRMAMMACLLRDEAAWRKTMRIEFDPDASTFGELLSDLTRQTGLKVKFELSPEVLNTPASINFPLSVMELTAYLLGNSPTVALLENGELRITNAQNGRAYLAEWLKEWK